MSYKKGLFFFQVLYSENCQHGFASSVSEVLTFIDQALNLIVFLLLDHVDCRPRVSSGPLSGEIGRGG